MLSQSHNRIIISRVYFCKEGDGMKRLVILLMVLLLLTACGKGSTLPAYDDAVEIRLSDEVVTVDGVTAAVDEGTVYTAHDIVYYEEGKGIAYGEGTEQDTHSAEEALAHTVVHITKAGTYAVSGKLSRGQIAVDLGKDTKDDPEAVVTLILDGVDITCEVAPAVIFYNVYECGDTDTDKATKDVDTSAAGANVVIADGTANTVSGAYVARIYKPDSVEMNEDNTEVLEAKKLHKYDGAFYSKMSMNVGGGKKGNGILHINASNEGLDSELHLTINGGHISIRSGNDGINTNEDDVSVTTINGGVLNITVTGETGEGDGIDSNGWLVINGGTVTASACSSSADAGIDSDRGIHINGGTVVASGHMLDRIEDGGQTYAVFHFAQKQNEAVTLKDKNGKAVARFAAENRYSVLVYSSPKLKAGTYTLWSGDKQLGGRNGGTGGGFERPSQMPDGMRPDGFEPPERPEGEMPERPEGEMPQGRPEFPSGEWPPMGQKPSEDSERPFGQPGSGVGSQEITSEFVIVDGANMFAGITYVN